MRKVGLPCWWKHVDCCSYPPFLVNDQVVEETYEFPFICIACTGVLVMYFPIGWPKVLNDNIDNGNEECRKILCNRDRILFAVLSDSQITIWFSMVSFFQLCRYVCEACLK